jgi:hypothetical protein
MTEWTKISWEEGELIERLAEKEGLSFSEYLQKVYEESKK